jgi:outer membrane protein assembly factor BamB
MVALAAAVVAQMRLAPMWAQGSGNWLQWGGPNRNFTAESIGLRTTWPAQGPARLWRRPIGEGHSSILVEAGRLYTLHRPPGQPPNRRSQQEAVIAMDAANGTTLWEFAYPSPTAGVDYSEGAGPHATPLLAGARLFVATSRRELFALDKTTGKQLWFHDFIREYRAPSPDRGYAASPLAYGSTVIATVGGARQAVAAFDQETGALVWRAGDAQHSPASPILIDVDGQMQLVVFGGDRIVGMNPSNGYVLWTHPHKTDWGLNISTPVWAPALRLLFVSSAYGVGSRALELRQAGGRTAVVEKWHSPRMRVHIGSVIHAGEYVYGSSGDFGPAFLSAINLKTGSVAWQERGFARAQLVYADGKLIVLDEDGTLALTTASPEGLKVLARAPVMERVSWTPPTLVERTLYARDRKTIAAFDLGS